MSGSLEGIRVISFTHYLQGPSCVQFLADLGADVIKVERIGGAYERHWSGSKAFLENDMSVFFLLAGRNQRSIEVDLRSDEGKKVLWKIIETADVIVENFRPGTLERHGFSYENVKTKNNRIIYCSLTGYGSQGPSKTKPGQDLLIQSVSGLARLNGREEDPPIPVGSAIVDQHAAALGAMGILAALLKRNSTGRGSKVEGNLLSAALDLQLEPLNYHLNGAKLWERSKSGISSRFHQAPYGVFKTADGWLTLSLADGPTLAKVFDDPQFEKWNKEDQFDYREDVNKRVAGHMMNKKTADWEEIMGEIGLWFAPVNEYDELLKDPQLSSNESIMEFEHPKAGKVKLIAHPIQYDGSVPPLKRMPPSPGQQTDEVLKEIGYSESDLTKMRNKGSIGPDITKVEFDQAVSAPASAYSNSKPTRLNKN